MTTLSGPMCPNCRTNLTRDNICRMYLKGDCAHCGISLSSSLGSKDKVWNPITLEEEIKQLEERILDAEGKIVLFKEQLATNPMNRDASTMLGAYQRHLKQWRTKLQTWQLETIYEAS